MPKLEETEAQIQSASLAWLRANGVLCWRQSNQPVPIRKGKYVVGFRNSDVHTVGIPDSFVVIDGHLYGVEYKSRRGVMSEAQCGWREKLERAGAHYLLARSVDDVIKFFEPLLKK